VFRCVRYQGFHVTVGDNFNVSIFVLDEIRIRGVIVGFNIFFEGSICGRTIFWTWQSTKEEHSSLWLRSVCHLVSEIVSLRGAQGLWCVRICQFAFTANALVGLVAAGVVGASSSSSEVDEGESSGMSESIFMLFEVGIEVRFVRHILIL